MKFPKARKFFGAMRKRIYGIFGRKIIATATPSKSKQPNIKQPIGHCRLPMELECASITAITMDLPHPHYRKLPAELNQQIFLCFNPATQRKFISGLGWDFYAMFRHRLLIKTKRIRNPHGNRWNGTNMTPIIAANGLNVSNSTGLFAEVSDNIGAPNVCAEHPFPISGPQCRARMDGFPGTICYYYEVKGRLRMVGLSDGAIPDDDDESWIGEYSNSYAIPTADFYYECWLAGETHHFQLPKGAIRPKRKHNLDVFGCGLVVDSEDKLWIFFTLNGKLMGRKIAITPTVDRPFPAIKMMSDEPIEANFGDNPPKPFKYDIKKCPGLELA